MVLRARAEEPMFSFSKVLIRMNRVMIRDVRLEIIEGQDGNFQMLCRERASRCFDVSR